MAAQPVVTVFGATGNQGGGVANQLLSSGKYAVRAVTRNTTKPAAQKLSAAGAELVTADLNDEAALEQALQGAWAVFAVTNFWDPTNTGQETVQGERLARVARAAGVKVFLWSSLPNAAKVSSGKWEVAHFSDKAKAEPSILEQGFEYVAFLEPPYYFEVTLATEHEGHVYEGERGWRGGVQPSAVTRHQARGRGPLRRDGQGRARGAGGRIGRAALQRPARRAVRLQRAGVQVAVGLRGRHRPQSKAECGAAGGAHEAERGAGPNVWLVPGARVLRRH